MSLAYMRTKGIATERAFGPKTADHPSVDSPCPACHALFKEGDFTTLIPLGPGDSEDARARAAAGRYYNAVAVEVHYACATGIDLTVTP